MAAATTASAVTGLVGANTARQAAKGAENAKKNAQDDLIMENRKRATKDYLREVRLEQLTQQQETEVLAEKSFDVAKNTIDAKGQTEASAAERGVGGRSLDMVLADFDFQQNQEVGRMRINQEKANAQHGENIETYKDQFTERASAIKPYVPRVQPPVDYFGPIFGALAGNASASMAKGLGAGPTGAPAAPTAAPDYGSQFLAGTGSTVNGKY